MRKGHALLAAALLPLASSFGVSSGLCRAPNVQCVGRGVSVAMAADDDMLLDDEMALSDDEMALEEEEEQGAFVDPAARSIEPLFCLNVRLAVRPDRRDEFLACIENNQRGTLTDEALAVTYQFGEDVNVPNTFHFHERYQGAQGFEEHTQSAHFASWKEFEATEPFTEPPRVEFYTESVADVDVAKAKPYYCLNVRLAVKEERRDDFLSCIANNQDGTLADEELSVTYRYGEDADSPNVFHFHERYEGEAGFEAHTSAAHFAAWKEFEATEPFTEPPRVEFYVESVEEAEEAELDEEEDEEPPVF